MNPALRQVSYEQAKKFADLNRLKFEETSALTNARVTDVFDNLLHCNNYDNNFINSYL
jgi:Ras family